MFYDIYNYSIHGVYQPTYNWGANIVQSPLDTSCFMVINGWTDGS